MPFTLAHPAAAVPLVRPLGRFGVLPALVVGSLVPDLPYFVPLPLERGATHSLLGLVWFCLPAGLFLYAVFQSLLRAPCSHGLAALAPEPLALRLRQLGAARRPRWLAVAVSVLVGAGTHIAWDGFTHADGFGVAVFPSLRELLVSTGGYELRVYGVLQHGSTALGLVLLLVWLGRWVSGSMPVRWDALPPRARAWILGLSIGGAVVGGSWVLAILSVAPPQEALAVLREALGRSVVELCRWTLVALGLACLGWQVSARQLRAAKR